MKKLITMVRKLKSISLILRNDKNQVIGLLCINLDISIFDKYHGMLKVFLSNNDNQVSSQEEILFKNDVYEKINKYVQIYCDQGNLNIEALNRSEKRTLILELKAKGALTAKNAASYIARILNISRATVYNYLKQQ